MAGNAGGRMKISVRKARKVHVCVWCNGMIQPGERYAHHTALPNVPEDVDFVIDGKPTTFAMHPFNDNECRERRRESDRRYRDRQQEREWLEARNG